jgi:hypothetical protein
MRLACSSESARTGPLLVLAQSPGPSPRAGRGGAGRKKAHTPGMLIRRLLITCLFEHLAGFSTLDVDHFLKVLDQDLSSSTPLTPTWKARTAVPTEISCRYLVHVS